MYKNGERKKTMNKIKKEPKKMGRPRINSEACQTYKYLPIRPDDHSKIKAKASERGISMIEYVSLIAKNLK